MSCRRSSMGASRGFVGALAGSLAGAAGLGQGQLVLQRSRPLLAAAANCQSGSSPKRPATACAATAIASQASANGEARGWIGGSEGSSAYASAVKAARSGSARAAKRRSQPRTVSRGRPRRAGGGRGPPPPPLSPLPPPPPPAGEAPGAQDGCAVRAGEQALVEHALDFRLVGPYDQHRSVARGPPLVFADRGGAVPLLRRRYGRASPPRSPSTTAPPARDAHARTPVDMAPGWTARCPPGLGQALRLAHMPTGALLLTNLNEEKPRAGRGLILSLDGATRRLDPQAGWRSTGPKAALGNHGFATLKEGFAAHVGSPRADGEGGI